MAPKRKHCEVTLKVKYNALKELEKGRLNKDVAEEFKIPSIVCTKIIGLEFCNGHNFVTFYSFLLIFSQGVGIKEHFDIM